MNGHTQMVILNWCRNGRLATARGRLAWPDPLLPQLLLGYP